MPALLKHWRYVANFALFQIAWFAIILAPLGWDVAAGAALLALHFAFIARPQEWRLIAAAAGVGFLIETAMALLGIHQLDKNAALIPQLPYLAPPWLLLLWAHFGATLNHSLAWMRAWPKLAFIGGAIAGPLVYLGGSAITTKLQIALETHHYILIISPLWAIICITLPAAARSRQQSSDR